jgi:hypothetical protein
MLQCVTDVIELPEGDDRESSHEDSPPTMIRPTTYDNTCVLNVCFPRPTPVDMVKKVMAAYHFIIGNKFQNTRLGAVL